MLSQGQTPFLFTQSINNWQSESTDTLSKCISLAIITAILKAQASNIKAELADAAAAAAANSINNTTKTISSNHTYTSHAQAFHKSTIQVYFHRAIRGLNPPCWSITSRIQISTSLSSDLRFARQNSLAHDWILKLTRNESTGSCSKTKNTYRLPESRSTNSQILYNTSHIVLHCASTQKTLTQVLEEDSTPLPILIDKRTIPHFLSPLTKQQTVSSSIPQIGQRGPDVLFFLHKSFPSCQSLYTSPPQKCLTFSRNTPWQIQSQFLSALVIEGAALANPLLFTAPFAVYYPFFTV